jgi:hypothetical protein
MNCGRRGRSWKRQERGNGNSGVGSRPSSDRPEVFQERDRAIPGLRPRPVEVIVELGVIVEGQIDGYRFPLNEVADVVLDQLGL